MKKMIILIIFCFIFKTGFSQYLNDSLYLHLYNYSFITNGLTKSNIDESGMGSFERFFNIQELVKNTNSDEFKIYTFRTSPSELPYRDFLVIENGIYELYNIICLTSLIDKILDSNIDFETKTLWIKEIFKIANDGHFSGVELENLIFGIDFDSIIYIIPGSMLKNIP